MPDREKVIKGLECHKSGICDNDKMLCPYWKEEADCSKKLIDDTLELLKEQEDVLEQMSLDNDDLRKCYKELLKEQEAVTIKKTKEHGFGVYGGICPKCRNWIQSAHSFCGFCGQAVKWE